MDVNTSSLNGYLKENVLIYSLQGKDLLAKVIAEVSSVTKLAKIVKTTSATTFLFDSRCFCEYYNGT